MCTAGLDLVRRVGYLADVPTFLVFEVLLLASEQLMDLTLHVSCFEGFFCSSLALTVKRELSRAQATL